MSSSWQRALRADGRLISGACRARDRRCHRHRAGLGRLTGLSVSGFLLVFNLAMLVWGWAVLGRAFALNTLASSILSPVFLALWEQLLADRVLTEDIFLCTVFAGLGIGVALGWSSGRCLHRRHGHPAAGAPEMVPPAGVSHNDGLRHRHPAGAALFSPPEQVLYGIVMVILHTIVMDKMLLLGDSRTQVKIVSARSDEIRDAILEQIDRGVTILHGEGGYTHELLRCCSASFPTGSCPNSKNSSIPSTRNAFSSSAASPKSAGAVSRWKSSINKIKRRYPL